MSPYAQYGMYGFLAVVTLAGTYLKIIPPEAGVPIFTSLVGVTIGWHIPSPQTPLTTVQTSQATVVSDKTQVNETPR